MARCIGQCRRSRATVVLVVAVTGVRKGWVVADDGGSEVVRLDQRVPFTMVDNPVIRALPDYVALGLYVDMLSWPPGWRINLREMARTHKQGRTVLTAAMNELISRGLVFRVRYQQPSGQWMTRTYVCARPVTASELDAVRGQYRGRCSIETTKELSPRHDAETPETVEDLDSRPAGDGGGVPQPSTRFPALGEPGSGQPGVGDPAARQPNVGVPVPQRSDPRPKTPPPPPVASQDLEPVEVGGGGEAGTDAGRGDVSGSAAVERVLGAVARAWAQIGRRDLSLLRGPVDVALGYSSEPELIEWLTSNTSGATYPAGVLRARLQNLPVGRPREAEKSAPWCEQCASPDYRWIEDADGRPTHPCPRCSPQARTSRPTAA